MKLTEKDIAILKEMGFPDEDMGQIGEAMTKTIYTLRTKDGEEKRISRAKAREILGDREYLSGIGRSAFHWNCARGKEDSRVSFDSSRLFK